MEIQLIRHGKTEGNEKRLFVGRLDEELSTAGREEAEAARERYKSIGAVYSSPMKRCIETAEIIFGRNKELKIIDGLREMDFGIFDGKSFDEITKNEEYCDFGCSEDKMYFPQGERIEDFKQRCINAFKEILERGESCSVVCHGGVIMAIVEWLSKGEMTFYDGMCKNTEGFCVLIENGEISLERMGNREE